MISDRRWGSERSGYWSRGARPGQQAQLRIYHMAGRGLVQQLPGSLRSSALARCPSQNSILYNSLMTFRS